MVVKWKESEVHNGVVYRMKESPRSGEPDFKQLLLPLTQEEEALLQCHAGAVAVHFGIRKMLDEVRRRFYLPTWKEDTKRFCRRCPHPKSDRIHLWILTCMDSWTKWTEAYPLRNKEAETVAKVLVEQAFTRFGVPLSILSDQGKEVDGRIMREVCRLFGIEKLRSTPYKPSTNQVERFHRTMNSILAKTVTEHQRDWDMRLPYAVAAYRVSRCTGK